MDDVNARQAVLEEYKTLRQEILNHQQFVHQINTTGVTIGAGIAALLLTKKADLDPATLTALCIGVVIIYLPLIMSQIHRRRKELRIGRYIQVFIEPVVPGLCWESTWRHSTKVFEGSAFYEAGLLLLLQTSYGIFAVFTSVGMGALSLASAVNISYFFPKAISLSLVILVAFEFRLISKNSLEKIEKEWIGLKNRREIEDAQRNLFRHHYPPSCPIDRFTA